MPEEIKNFKDSLSLGARIAHWEERLKEQETRILKSEVSLIVLQFVSAFAVCGLSIAELLLLTGEFLILTKIFVSIAITLWVYGVFTCLFGHVLQLLRLDIGWAAQEACLLEQMIKELKEEEAKQDAAYEL